MNWMKKVQWDVVWSTCRTLLVAGGPVTTMLIAFGFPPIEVGKWAAAGLAAVGVLSIVGPGLYGALLRTDSGKVASVAALPDEKKAAAVAALPAEAQHSIAAALPVSIKAADAANLGPQDALRVAAALPNEANLAAVNSMPEVTKVIVRDNAVNGVGTALKDSSLEKIVPQSQQEDGKS